MDKFNNLAINLKINYINIYMCEYSKLKTIQVHKVYLKIYHELYLVKYGGRPLRSTQVFLYIELKLRTSITMSNSISNVQQNNAQPS